MSPEDALKVIAIDAWYKAMLYLGAIGLFVSLFWEIKGNGLTNQQLQMLAGGFSLFGLGEWKNHKVDSWIKEANAYTGGAALMSKTVRRPDVVGTLLNLAGIGLTVTAVVKIYRG